MTLSKKETLYETTANTLIKSDISSVRIGYTYILEAVVYIICNGGSVAGITKIIYPYLAKKFCTSVYAVERAIRTVISDACNGNNEYIRSLCGAKEGDALHITNKEFIYKSVKTVKNQLEIVNYDEY